jgi:hypothetical protein
MGFTIPVDLTTVPTSRRLTRTTCASGRGFSERVAAARPQTTAAAARAAIAMPPATNFLKRLPFMQRSFEKEDVSNVSET